MNQTSLIPIPSATVCTSPSTKALHISSSRAVMVGVIVPVTSELTLGTTYGERDKLITWVGGARFVPF